MSSINAGTGIVYTNDGSGTLDLQGGGSSGISVNSNGAYVKTVASTASVTGTAGMLVYDTSANSLSGYAGDHWETISVSNNAPNTRAIFGYGWNGTSTYYSITNLVSNTGVVAGDTTGVGTARRGLAGTSYGGDKGIFGYGTTAAAYSSLTNLVSNSGVVAADTTGVGTARQELAAAGYGTDKAIFGFGFTSSTVSTTNLVSSTGVVGSDVTGIGTGRTNLTAATYGSDKAIFSGTTASNVTNLVSSTGVVATDTTGVGTGRRNLAATGYSQS